MSRRPKALWPNLVALATIVAFWTVLDIALIRAWWQGYSLLKHGVRATGVVTHLWGRSQRGYAFSYEFEADHRSYEIDAKTNGKTYRSLAEGQHIAIVYLRGDPRAAALERGLSAFAVWTWAMGLLVFNCFVWGMFVWLMRARGHT